MRIAPALLITLLSNSPHVFASEIMQISDYHADEARVTTNGKWLALQSHEDRWKLVNVDPHFVRIDDPILDPQKGIRVGVDIPDVEVLLMDKRLRAGPVRVASDQTTDAALAEVDSRLPAEGQERILSLNSQQYQLKNIKGEIILESQGISQSLFSYSAENETNAHIVWIGDLDNDGKLDLIVDASDHYNVNELRLYLSGKAPSGSLVSLAAKRRKTGC